MSITVLENHAGCVPTGGVSLMARQDMVRCFMWGMMIRNNQENTDI
jgi:hypothetical protein